MLLLPPPPAQSVYKMFTPTRAGRRDASASRVKKTCGITEQRSTWRTKQPNKNSQRATQVTWGILHKQQNMHQQVLRCLTQKDCRAKPWKNISQRDQQTTLAGESDVIKSVARCSIRHSVYQNTVKDNPCMIAKEHETERIKSSTTYKQKCTVVNAHQFFWPLLTYPIFIIFITNGAKFM